MMERETGWWHSGYQLYHGVELMEQVKKVEEQFGFEPPGRRREEWHRRALIGCHVCSNPTEAELA